MVDLERHSVALGVRPALLLVDLVRGFTDPACPLGSESGAVLAANRRLLDFFRARRLPRFFTTIVYRNPRDAWVLRRHLPVLELMSEGSPWTQVDEQLQAAPDEPLIERCWPSAFFRTDLAQRLAKAGADSLVLTGLTTSGCVRASALDGLQHDYPVHIPRDAVGDRNPRAHEANLFDLHAKYAEVSSVEKVLKSLAKTTAA